MLQTKEKKKSAFSPHLSLTPSLPLLPLQPPETEGQRNNLTLGNWCGTEMKTLDFLCLMHWKHQLYINTLGFSELYSKVHSGHTALFHNGKPLWNDQAHTQSKPETWPLFTLAPLLSAAMCYYWTSRAHPPLTLHTSSVPSWHHSTNFIPHCCIFHFFFSTWSLSILQKKKILNFTFPSSCHFTSLLPVRDNLKKLSKCCLQLFPFPLLNPSTSGFGPHHSSMMRWWPR